MAIRSFPGHLQLDDQLQCRLLRLDGRDDVVLATNMPAVHTYSRLRANNMTHDFHDSRLARQRGSSESKRQGHER